MPPDKKDKLLRIEQVKNRLNCTRRHVYYLISEGHLAALKIGEKKGLRVRESDLELFIEKRAMAFEKENGTSRN